MNTHPITRHTANKYKAAAANFEEALYDSMLLYSLRHLAFTDHAPTQSMLDTLQKALQVCYLAGINSKQHFKQIYVFDFSILNKQDRFRNKFGMTKHNKSPSLQRGGLFGLYLALFKINMVAIEKTLKEGDSFLYTYLETKRNYGFVLINSIPNRGRHPRFYQFALINLPSKDNVSLDDFKNGGFLYSKMIPNGRTRKENLGIYTWDFSKEYFYFLHKFNFIGTLEMDRSKFMIGSGGNPPPEVFLHHIFNNIDVLMTPYDKTPLSTILS